MRNGLIPLLLGGARCCGSCAPPVISPSSSSRRRRRGRSSARGAGHASSLWKRKSSTRKMTDDTETRSGPVPSGREVIERVITATGEWQLQRTGSHYEIICNGVFLMASYGPVRLDTDNGPGWLVREANARLYGPQVLTGFLQALRPGGVLGCWSAEPAPRLAETLARAGASVDVIEVEDRIAPDRRGTAWLYLAQRH